MKKKKVTLEDVGEQLAHIVGAIGELPTKEDHARLETKVDVLDGRMDKLDGRMDILTAQATNIESELRSIRYDLRTLRDKVENIEGYRVEIDHALERIAAIEKHLGMHNKSVGSV